MRIELEQIKVTFDYDEGEAADIKRCLETLYQTPEGTCPLDRGFGLTMDLVGLPLDVAKNEFAIEIITKTEKYEPRAEIKEILFDMSADGKMRAEVLLTNGGYNTER